MGDIRLAQPHPDAFKELRRAARIRKVRPVAFAAPGDASETFRRTVTANVSRGGMLLVSRKDRFPPAGSALTIMPYDASAHGLWGAVAIPGRIVYTRFSPRTDLRFAGLKFEVELSDTAAHSIGVNGVPDAVAHTLQALERVEAMADELVLPDRPTAPTVESIGRELVAMRRGMDELCTLFFHATESFLRAWGEERLRATIAQRHALALAKGSAGLRALKDEWRGLEEGFPALVDAQLNRDSLWPHRQRQDQPPITSDEAWFYDLEHDRPPARITGELRKLAGFIGRLIIRHGFEDIAAGGDWTPIAHEKALVAFTGTFGISDAMREVLLRGAAMADEYRNLLQRADEAGQDALRVKALQLWDAA